MKLYWRPRALDTEDLPQFLPLKAHIFREAPMSSVQWKWKFSDGPWGRAIAQIGVDNADPQLIAGHFATVPYFLKVGSEKVLACQSVDVFVNQGYEHRREKVFLFLAEEVYTQEKNRGTQIIFGFPNVHSYPGFIHLLSFKNPFNLFYYQLPLRVGFFARRIKFFSSLSWLQSWSLRLRPTVPKMYQFQKVEVLPRDWESFVDRALAAFPIAVLRSREYMQWRFFDAPSFKYEAIELRRSQELVGFAIVKVVEKEMKYSIGHLVDFLALETEDWSTLLKSVVLHFQRTQVESIVTFLNPKHCISNLFVKTGFIQRNSTGGTHFILRSLVESKFGVDPLCAKNWFLTPGDTDFF